MTRPSFDAKSIEKFNNCLSNTNWNIVYSSLCTSSDPSAAYDCFFSIYRSIFDACFPEYSVKKSNRMTPRHVWMTKGLMKSCVRKSNLYRKYCKNKTKYNKDRYNTYRNRLKGLLLKAEKSFYSEKFKSISGNIKET